MRGNPVLEGERFGKLTVLRREGSDRKKQSVWRCKCDCGKECLSPGPRLREGSKNSCGCLQSCEEHVFNRAEARKRKHAESVVSIQGARFGRLLVITDSLTPIVECLCDCGSRNLSKRYVLLAGNKKSCGCLKRDRLSELAKSQNRQARLRAGIPEDENIYERQPIPGLAKLIKIRDDFTCALCKVRGVKLVTHHIISWFMNRELHGEPSNLVTLCDVCHKTKAHRGGFKIPPDPAIAEILKKHVEGLPLGGALEKHGTLELTEEEQLLILSGVIPERIKRNWDDLSLSELQQTVNRLRNKG